MLFPLGIIRLKSFWIPRLDPEGNNKTMRHITSVAENSYMSEDAIYEWPEPFMKRNEAGSTSQESSVYMSLKEHREPDNDYQPLQSPEAVKYQNSTFIVAGKIM